MSWWLSGKTYASGAVPPHLLMHPQPGDFVILTPPPSKADPFDMVWGDKPVWLPYSSDPLAAFNYLASIERCDPIIDTPALTALFTGDDGLPFSGSQLDTLLQHMLRRHFDADTARLYSWHSARIWLCCSLIASNCPRPLVQALCRWQTEQSINVYTCLQPDQYASLLGAAMQVRISGARAATLAAAAPFIDITDVRRHAADSLRAAPVADSIDANVDPERDFDDD